MRAATGAKKTSAERVGAEEPGAVAAPRPRAPAPRAPRSAARSARTASATARSRRRRGAGSSGRPRAAAGSSRASPPPASAPARARARSRGPEAALGMPLGERLGDGEAVPERRARGRPRTTRSAGTVRATAEVGAAVRGSPGSRAARSAPSPACRTGRTSASRAATSSSSRGRRWRGYRSWAAPPAPPSHPRLRQSLRLNAQESVTHGAHAREPDRRASAQAGAAFGSGRAGVSARRLSAKPRFRVERSGDPMVGSTA